MGAEKHPDDKPASEVSHDEAAQHVNPTPKDPAPERYPAVNRDDSINPEPANEDR